MPINQPSNQIKLTNVSVVRLKKGGKRFEIACYKNKVQEWRTGVTTDIDEVLQINNVFLNVSKGQVASSIDLQVFEKTDLNDIVKEILKKGELQVGEKERAQDLENLWKEIANQVAEKCVDPETQKPYPVSMIEKGMNEAGFSVKIGKSSKSQVLDCIKLLQTKSTLPIQRSRMRVKITMPSKDGERLKEKILESAETIEDDKLGQDDGSLVMLIDPGQFKVLTELLQKEVQGVGRMETIQKSVVQES